jgi:hypothetical protein
VAIAVLGGRAESLASMQDFRCVVPATIVGEHRYRALNSRRSRENLAPVHMERLFAFVATLTLLLRIVALFA